MTNAELVGRRKTERVLIQIPVLVEGKDSQGKGFSEKCSTVVINRNGARIGLSTPLRPEDPISVTNLQNRMSSPFRVVGRVKKPLTPQAEWGVECLEPQKNFWGIFFPEKIHPVGDKNVDVLMECSACHMRELAQLDLQEYKMVARQSSTSRACTTCRGRTQWNFCYEEGRVHGAVAVPAGQLKGPVPVGRAERRRARRLTVKLPLRVRFPGGGEEVTRTENLSKTGICFYARHEMKGGDVVGVTVGYSGGQDQVEMKACIVWSRAAGEGGQFIYGAHLEEK